MMLYTVTIRQGCLACEQNFHLGNILKVEHTRERYLSRLRHSIALLAPMESLLAG